MPKKTTSRKPSDPGKKKKTVKTNRRKVKNTRSEWPFLVPAVFAILCFINAACLYFPDVCGTVGMGLHNLLIGLFGATAYAVPVLILYPIFTWRRNKTAKKRGWKIVAATAVLLFGSAFVHIITGAENSYDFGLLYNNGKILVGGGVFGGILGSAARTGFGFFAPILLAIALILIILAVFDLTPVAIVLRLTRKRDARRDRKNAENGDEEIGEQIQEWKEETSVFFRSRNAAVNAGNAGKTVTAPQESEVKETVAVLEQTEEKKEPEPVPIVSSVSVPDPVITQDETADEIEEYDGDDGIEELEEVDDTPAPPEKEEKPWLAHLPGRSENKSEVPVHSTHKPMFDASASERSVSAEVKCDSGYLFPSTELLTKPENTEETEEELRELRENGDALVNTLAEFGVRVRLLDIIHGPTLTRYEIIPEAGVSVSSIAKRAGDISMNLAAESIRIESPIPGKRAVGIEIPNRTKRPVYIRELLEDPEFRNAKSKTICALGKDVEGKSMFLDIAEMPHLCVAGATGMGKSVCINSLIVSLLYKATPDDVRVIMIDPKSVEFTNFVGIPHLLVPVVIEPKKALGTIQWAVNEMNRRYDVLHNNGVQKLSEYNALPGIEKMPTVVIIIDELADLMMSVPDIETGLAILAQKARAAGIHLILGTQRPSVDVITGSIKNNIPSRIACRVSSQVDSRTILDCAGAEKLVGKGDMLFSPSGCLHPFRLQGTFVSGSEIKKVVAFIKETSECVYDENIIAEISKNAAKDSKGDAGSGGGDDEEDELLWEALKIVVESGKAAASFLQRRLGIGFPRAAKIIDQLEARKFIAPADGNKPRDVLMDRAEYEEYMMRNGAE